MNIFTYTPEELLGTVDSVDTSTAVVKVEKEDMLKGLQVNNLVAINSPRPGQHLIGLISKIIRQASFMDANLFLEDNKANSIIKVVLIGTFFDQEGDKENVFRRSLSTVPTIKAECYLITGERLRKFIETVSDVSEDKEKTCLQIGKYTIDEGAVAWINGNKLFQRHAVIVGSTGSGKSWCVARILEQVATLKSADAILFDIHGEYKPLAGEGFTQLKVAGPNDGIDNQILYLPYWLLSYEEMLTFLLGKSDVSAPNLAAVLGELVIGGKKEYLEDLNKKKMMESITLDSPIPYKLDDLITSLKKKDGEMLEGANNREKQGPNHGKLTRFINRLNVKKTDKRLNFMFSDNEELLEYDYMEKLCSQLMLPSGKETGGVKVIDFSEVPSDILPLVVSLIARVVFSVQQWTKESQRHPIAILCDEAHLYLPANPGSSVEAASAETFERIAKEGRKYGVSLVVISQRPSEVSHTILSQSNNFIAMRLTNAEDQAVVKRLLPDNLNDYADMLPILDVGEALVVGDANPFPSRIKITAPTLKPNSATIDFWTKWDSDSKKVNIGSAIESLRKQSK